MTNVAVEKLFVMCAVVTFALFAADATYVAMLAKSAKKGKEV